jgi:hypothetical protein
MKVSFQFTILAFLCFSFGSDSQLVYERQKLVSNDGNANDAFGYSVSLSGNITVVAAVGATINGRNDQGAAYVFLQNEGTNCWTQQQKLIENIGSTNDFFGHFRKFDSHWSLWRDN